MNLNLGGFPFGGHVVLETDLAEQLGIWDERMFVEATFDALMVQCSAHVVRLVLFLALEAYP